MLGAHTIKTWSSTQTGVALSSGEAELNGVLKGSAMGLGFQSLLQIWASKCRYEFGPIHRPRLASAIAKASANSGT